jgi:hypothetical protein
MMMSVFDQTNEEIGNLRCQLRLKIQNNWDDFCDTVCYDTIDLIDECITNEETRDELTIELGEIVSDELTRFTKNLNKTKW